MSPHRANLHVRGFGLFNWVYLPGSLRHPSLIHIRYEQKPSSSFFLPHFLQIGFRFA